MMHQNDREPGLDPAQQLEGDWALFQAVETGAARHRHRCWHSAAPVVVAGRHSILADDVIEDACRADNVRVLRRFSGGGTVVLGPGCLNYAVALALVSRPGLADVGASFQLILQTIASALDLPGLSVAGGTDLVFEGRKVSGNAQRRGRLALIHHGTLLYDFDAELATRYLKEPVRQPAHRALRPHTDFIGNLPLPADTVRARLETGLRALCDESPAT
jgi:lipoate-protein ligase A